MIGRTDESLDVKGGVRLWRQRAVVEHRFSVTAE